MKSFQSYHPFLLLIYFISMICICVATLNPLPSVIAFVCIICFCISLQGYKKTFQSLCYCVVLMIIITLAHAILIGRGGTILFFLNDNPITLESILQGATLSVITMSVYFLCKCYTFVMTSDKFIFLFGRIVPKFSLFLSMMLCFIPKFKRQYKLIKSAQKTLGIYASKSIVDKIKSTFRAISMVIMWSIENSITTSDSMRARGYGMKGRTCLCQYRWKFRDSILLAAILVLTAFVCAFYFLNIFMFFPSISQIVISWFSICAYVALFIVMFLSTAIEIKENIKWRLLISRI